MHKPVLLDVRVVLVSIKMTEVFFFFIFAGQLCIWGPKSVFTFRLAAFDGGDSTCSWLIGWE